MIRRTLLATFLATVTAVSVTVVASTPAQARACRIDHFCYTTWYSDATYTTAVGGKFENCDGATSTWGRRSGHVEFEETPC
jgi:hypothetical protein